MSRPLPLAVAVLAVVLALSGCVGGSPIAATDAARTATPTPTQPPPEPVDPLTTVTTLVAMPAGLELRDDSGVVVTTLDYLSDPALAIATLETVFGTAPVSEEYGGRREVAPPSTVHRWDGFELSEQRYVGQWEGVGTPPTLYWPSFRVTFTAPETGGVELATAGGPRAGDSWTAVLAEPELQLNPLHCTGPYIDFIDFTMAWYDDSERLVRVAVDLHPSDDATTVGSVGAPAWVDNCV